jgi:L-aminopeptidase/D-esterase-like protein
VSQPVIGSITDVPGIKVGHAQDDAALTGCTVILCEQGAVGGVDQRGGAPGTRETDLLRPMHLVQRVHAVLLAGGSAFGLAAADGVVRWLEEQGHGFDVGVARVPIVPAAVLFDLDIGRADVHPTPGMGYAACQVADDGPVAEGCAGAGAGARVGTINGISRATKGGLGTASVDLGGGLVVGALFVANCFGDVVDPAGHIVAGARRAHGEDFVDTLRALGGKAGQPRQSIQPFGGTGNTVIGVVATNAALSKEGANKVAQMAQDGLARAVRPAHTMVDGDTIFSLSVGDKVADVTLVGAYAAEVTAQAILRAVLAATPAGGLPAARDLGSARE